jgi:hypothetical protein
MVCKTKKKDRIFLASKPTSIQNYIEIDSDKATSSPTTIKTQVINEQNIQENITKHPFMTTKSKGWSLQSNSSTNNITKNKYQKQTNRQEEAVRKSACQHVT